MAARSSNVVRQLCAVLAHEETARLADADLLARYVQERDAAAFETLVRRHGPMVHSVCRRILRNEQDAEDAFQATFLVLVRRAASLHSPSTLASWLHGVAYRTALEARSAAARRRVKEATVLPRTVVPDEPWVELWPVLDEELGRLAEKYRTVIVLCDLEGKTRREVARQLGCAEGTVASRLARGRGILAKRLARRGFTGSCVALALANGAASAHVPAGIVFSTVAAAGSCAATGAAAKAFVSTEVVALSEGVLKSMLLTKVKSAIAVLLVLGITVLGAGGLISTTLGTEPAADPPANPDDLHKRVVELKQQLQQMQQKIARLEQETQPRRSERSTCDTSFLAQRFKYKVPIEIGLTQNPEGGRIEIREIWGTRPRIEIGGQYLVRGKYTLPPGEQRGMLYFYATAGGAWGQTEVLDLQSTRVDKQSGEFALVHGMAGPGYFHLYLADAERYSRCFANVYFGSGDNVYRNKP
jgi:RNA polymerase sigma factor (sigma-70 family)